MDKLIDLRSDTVTKPSVAMREAMARAEVGDDVFQEDPTVRQLEEETASVLGKEAALYVSSGCMANQIGLAVSAGAGDEVIVEYNSHIFNYETTAASFLSRIQLHPVVAARHGLLTAAEVAPAFRDSAYYMPRTKLVALENTHNRAGGTVYPLERIAEISAMVHRRGAKMHLDGARLWNACAQSGHSPAEFASHFDTVSVCFSKGLGAPVGSAIAGTRDAIEDARRIRKIIGGGMRQAGIIAAGALYALRNNRERVVEDHRNARTFAEILATDAKHIKVDLETVQTNIVLFRVTTEADVAMVIRRMESRGVRLSGGANGLVRAIAHLDVTAADCEHAAKSIVAEFG